MAYEPYSQLAQNMPDNAYLIQQQMMDRQGGNGYPQGAEGEGFSTTGLISSMLAFETKRKFFGQYGRFGYGFTAGWKATTALEKSSWTGIVGTKGLITGEGVVGRFTNNILGRITGAEATGGILGALEKAFPAAESGIFAKAGKGILKVVGGTEGNWLTTVLRTPLEKVTAKAGIKVGAKMGARTLGHVLPGINIYMNAKLVYDIGKWATGTTLSAIGGTAANTIRAIRALNTIDFKIGSPDVGSTKPFSLAGAANEHQRAMSMIQNSHGVMGQLSTRSYVFGNEAELQHYM